ncbi:unnamed protein product [Callosobruchus maculatus]|uniref:Protein sleepless n=1 Tax=Callosobruchus maculatus TaxID=64391 RepID=A0A653DSJ1_CALMS|nr:unnamed protein product [Callosobruchus maculatus]
MAAMKVLLFVTVIASAIAYAQSVKCYGCDSVVAGEKCTKDQAKGSNVIDCGKLSPLTGLQYACARYEYQAGTKQNTLRACVVKGKSCDTLAKESQVPLKNCKVCEEDNCNGN